MVFALDTGGTFTDLIVDTGTELRLFKAPTTPADPVDGVLDVLGVAADEMGLTRDELLAAGDMFIHGTTRAINALVTATTARTAFLTTEGHPDILLFREGGRARPFDFSTPYPDPLVPRALTFEVRERVASDGTIHVPLDEAALLAVLDALPAAGVEAVAVTLLWSIANPVHELRIGELLDERCPGLPYTLSHRLNPTLREYRRASSACIDASLKPLMSGYLASLERRLGEAGFGGRVLIVTSQGAMLDSQDVAEAPVHAINSGPAMAPVAGRYYARGEDGSGTVIVADTGGTTFDVSVVREGRIPRTHETWIGPVHQGHITGFPSVDVTSVGAGGGSVAWVDSGGLLQVGPHSAGSRPGPACYGRGGTEATLTDACLTLGYIDADFFLGGAMPLDREAARRAIEHSVAGPLQLTQEDAAAAVLRVATENMVHAIEEITVSQGIDPREAVLVGGGGAAGLNLVAIARRLACRTVLIPETGAALSAAGALLSDLASEEALTYVTSTTDFDFDGVNQALSRLEERCARFIRRAAPAVAPSIEYSMEARYPRQNWEIEVPLERTRFGSVADVQALAEAFHETHARLFATSEPDSPVEIVTWRATGRARIRDSGRRLLRRSAELPPTRRVYSRASAWIDAPVVDLDELPDGIEVVGPAIVESSFTTVVVDAGARAERNARGVLAIAVEERR